jgi:hypothetical protein
MKTLVLISLLLMPLYIVGCASQLQPQQSPQALTERPEEETPKSAVPTFTYRPGE